jgi:hypothetical protein
MTRRPDPERFARELSVALRAAGEARAIQFDRGKFSLQVGGDRGAILNLEHLFAEYSAAPRRVRPQLIARYVRFFTDHAELPPHFELVRTSLLPRLYQRVYFEFIPLYARVNGTPGPQPSFPYHHIGGTLALGLVLDGREAVRLLDRAQFTQWGKNLDDAYSEALENLDRLTGRRLEPVAPGLFMSPYRDNADATRMMLLERIRELPVRGAPVAFVPHRDVLLITGSDDAEGLGKALDIVEKALAQPRAMNGIPLRLSENVWEDLEVPADHPLTGRLRHLTLQAWGRDYGEQKMLLDRIHAASGEGLVVATYSALRRERTGELVSYCTWSEGARALLPRTDYVALACADGTVTVARWDRVQAEAPGLMEPWSGVFPPRWKVEGFPGPEQRRRMDGVSPERL